jgi:hypothetical protein
MTKSTIITALLILALSPAGAQESRDVSQDKTPRPQLTLQLEDQTPRKATEQKLQQTELLKVKKLKPRPHGRSRVDPAPPPKPLIDPKRM